MEGPNGIAEWGVHVSVPLDFHFSCYPDHSQEVIARSSYPLPHVLGFGTYMLAGDKYQLFN